ncbi:MAG: type II and III secretion system protein family protein, partial [Atribacterota bacterium]
LDRINAAINALSEDGKAKILAKPKLIARSGGEADFWVGGEVPYLVSQGGLGGTTIKWKKYGVILKIKPSGDMKRNIININFTVEASNLDYKNAVQMEGFTIPAISTRKTSTSVQINNNETIVISGLKQLVKNKNEKGIPILSKIPIIGYLFKYEVSKDEDTEVTIFITPQFVKKQ